MRKLKTTTLLTACLIMLSFCAGAQKISQESKHKISKKAIKGGLVDFQIDEENNKMELTYLLKERKGDMDVERYVFDLDFNLIHQQEVLLQKEEAEAQYGYFRTKNSGATSLLQAGNNLGGQMVLKKGYLQWQPMGRIWITKFITTDKVKPKGTDGKKIGLISYVTQTPKFHNTTGVGSVRTLSVAQGDVTTVAMVNQGIPWKNYVINVFGVGNLEKKKETQLDLGYMYYPAVDAEMTNGDIGIVFVPIDQTQAEGAALWKNKDGATLPVAPNQEECLFVRIDPDGNVVEKTPFHHPHKHNYITILDYGDAVGLSIMSDTKTKSIAMGPIIARLPGVCADALNKDVYCMVKIQDGKMVYHSETPLTQILETAQLAPNVKGKLPKAAKPHKFFSVAAGYRMRNAGTTQTSDFVMAVIGQQMHMIQFSATSGDYEHCYFVSGDSKSAKGEQEVFSTVNGDAAYWITYESNPEKPEEKWANITRIDPKTGEMGPMVIPGQRDFFLDEAIPFSVIKGGEELIVFGRDGKTLYFAKMALI